MQMIKVELQVLMCIRGAMQMTAMGGEAEVEVRGVVTSCFLSAPIHPESLVRWVDTFELSINV